MPLIGERCRRLTADEDGFMIFELLMAVLVMTVGVMALLGTFDSSRKLADAAEMHVTGAALAEKEIQRIEAQPWSAIALKQTPTTNQGATPNDPTYYISNGPCPGSSNPPSSSPCYQWDLKDSTKVEPLVISPSGNGAQNPYGWSHSVSTSDGAVRLSGSIYRYITYVNDPNCTGSGCGGANDYRRITVAVTVSGLTKPIVLSTLYTNPVGSSQDPLAASGTTCLDGGNPVPCTH